MLKARSVHLEPGSPSSAGTAAGTMEMDYGESDGSDEAQAGLKGPSAAKVWRV